jgi:hypothetical protein
MKLRPIQKAQAESGFVMILALILTLSLSYLAMSSHGSVESKLAVQRNESDALRAELAAQAGLEHAKAMLVQNYYWTGTAGWVPLGNAQFEVRTEVVDDDQSDYVIIRATSEGKADNGKRVLAMEYRISDGDQMDDVGCYILTSNIDIATSHFNTDIYLADQAGVVYDYKMDALGNKIWTLNTTNMGPTMITNTMVNHTSFQYSNQLYFKGSYDKVILDTPFYMPSWNLDHYLIPSTDLIVLVGLEEISEINFHQTVVVKLDPGDTFNVNDCNLHGGLVIYVEPEYDVRVGARNYLSIDKSLIGSAANPHIGVLAPACEVKGGGQNITIHGFCYWNSMDDMDHAHVNGGLVVVNQVNDLDNFNFHGHPPTLQNPPEGIEFRESTPDITIITGGESIL